MFSVPWKEATSILNKRIAHKEGGKRDRKYILCIKQDLNICTALESIRVIIESRLNISTMQRTLPISRFVCRKPLTQCSTLLLLMPRRGGLLYLYNAKTFSMIRWYVLYSLSPCCRRGFNGSFGSGVNVFYSLSPCCRRGFNGSFGSGVKSLNTKIVRKITA